ncbi:MAG: hypothetical protein WD032_08080 [Nitrospirales bacterium]
MKEGVYREKILRSRERFLIRVQNRPILNPEQVRALNREWSSYYVMKGGFEGTGSVDGGSSTVSSVHSKRTVSVAWIYQILAGCSMVNAGA